MAPIRRYLRITKYSVLECRIYLDNPALAESWLLRLRDPVLPRVIERIRPLVLPKLREENERAKAKGGKKKIVKDVVVEEDFEVSLFLTETSARHSLLYKQRHFSEQRKSLESNSDRLLGATDNIPIDVDEIQTIRREESDEEAVNMEDLPEAQDVPEPDGLFVDHEESRRTKRLRPGATAEDVSSPEFDPTEDPPSKRQKDLAATFNDNDDKKKLAMETTYDGFSIYGRVLCMVVKRKDKKGKNPVMTGGQAMMEEWITSTQMPIPED